MTIILHFTHPKVCNKWLHSSQLLLFVLDEINLCLVQKSWCVLCDAQKYMRYICRNANKGDVVQVLTDVTEKWLGMSRSHEDFRDSLFVLIAVSILSCVLILFVYYNIAVVPNFVMASIELTGLVFCLLAYYFLWQSREVNLAANIMVSVMTSISYSLFTVLGTKSLRWLLLSSRLSLRYLCLAIA